MNVIRRNTREDLQLMQLFASTDVLEKKILMSVAEEVNKTKAEEIKEHYENDINYLLHFSLNDLAENINAPVDTIRNAERTIYKDETKRFDKMLDYKISTQKDIKINSKYEHFKCRTNVFSEFGISERGTFVVKVNAGALILFSRYLKYYRHYDIIEAKYLTVSSSIEFYKFLKDRINRGKERDFYISIESLKNELGISKNKYKLYGDLKRKVINPALADMQKNLCPTCFDYTEKKQGRKVIGLHIKTIENIQNKDDLYALERLAIYLKQTSDKEFKEFYADFCFAFQISEYKDDIKKVKTKDSFKKLSKKIQLKFINWLEPKLNI